MAAKKFDVQALMDEKAEEIDEAIQRIDNRLERLGVTELMEQRNKLVAARRALVGGGLTGGSTTKVRQQDVVDAIRQHGNMSAASLAQKMGVAETVVRSHLNRGRGERFLQDEDKLWYLRDPEAGINTEEDL